MNSDDIFSFKSLDGVTLTWEMVDKLKAERASISNAIESVLGFSNDSSVLGKLNTERDLFVESALRVRELINFEALSYYAVDSEDQGFYLSYCDFTKLSDFIERNRLDLIDDGTFSWSLAQSLPTVISSDIIGKSLFLAPLSARKRIMGVLIGVLDDGHLEELTDIRKSFITLVLKITAISLQNLDLYNLVQKLNRDLNRKVYSLTQSELELTKYKDTLEETVRKRTSALEKVNRELIVEKRKAERANEAKNLFLSNMSHEIRTPISVMLGMTDLALNSEGLGDENKNYLENSKKAGHGLLKLIDDLLLFVKIETGNFKLKNNSLNLRDLCEEVVKTVKLNYESSLLEISLEFDDSIPNCLISDEAFLKKVLFNLMDNGAKFTDKGYVKLSAFLVGEYKEDVKVRFSVRDTGPGITPDKHRAVFDVFFQADCSRSKKFKGAGLGLAICKKIVENLGGAISLESIFGEGTTFFVDLKFKRGEAIEGDFHNYIHGGHVPKDLSVLLVEDNILNRKLALAMMSDLEWAIDEAENGIEAVGAVKEKNYDLIFMDIQMPEMNGIEATEAIRRLKGNRPRGPLIIAMTANATSEDKDNCLESGMDDYLTKPVDKGKMIDMVSTYLG